MKIFLSYGHRAEGNLNGPCDVSEDLVLLIKADLEKRGHDVWLDREQIEFNDDWRRKITDGITASDRVLSFLSKRSARDPGVCRDEIQIAIGVKHGNIQTILVESEQEVKPPVNIGHIQWLDMHDWKEQQAAGCAVWDQWYQAKLAEIVRVVESEESRRFSGEIETLNRCLKPISSDARISELLGKGFYGREWLFEAVDAWRTASNSSRMCWILGAPGVGKSAFAARLTHTRGDVVIGAQFCEWNKDDHRSPTRVVCSLAFQIATRLPDYRKFLITLPEIDELDKKKEAELFDYLLVEPLHSAIGGNRERYLVVIDALDEAIQGGENPLVEMLANNAQRLPDWLRIVVTSRPESDVTVPFQGLTPHVLGAGTESNRNDIRNYLRDRLKDALRNRPDGESLIARILEKSEGVFLYVERFCNEIQGGDLSLESPEDFPQGLGGIYFQYFRRRFSDTDKYETVIEPVLGVIMAGGELPIAILGEVFSWKQPQLHKWLRMLGSLFPVTADVACDVITPYHKSVADWLSNSNNAGPFFVSVDEGHKTLAALGFAKLTSEHRGDESLPVAAYWSKTLLAHFAATHDWPGLISCVKSPEVFESIWPGAYNCFPFWSQYRGAKAAIEAPTNSGYFRRGIGKGDFRGGTNVLTPNLLNSEAQTKRSEVLWALAEAFADRTRHQQQRVFSYARRHGQYMQDIVRYLQQKESPDLLELYNSMYFFTALAGVPPLYVRAALDGEHASKQKAEAFVEENTPIWTYLNFLADWACCEGYSKYVELEASDAKDSWELLK